jgi:hypothetical protein
MSGASPSKLVPTELVVNTDTLDVDVRSKTEAATGLTMPLQQELKNEISRGVLRGFGGMGGGAVGSAGTQGSTIAVGGAWPGLQAAASNPFMDAWNAAHAISSPPEPLRPKANATIRITQAANGQVLDVAMGPRTVTWLVPDGEPLAANIDAALAGLKLEGGG